jgi:RimJ/RimL family protein N-acetyltransferase
MPTEREGLALYPFILPDVPEHAARVRGNAAHLTRFGDNEADAALDLVGWMERFVDPQDRDGVIRILLHGKLVGLIHLVPVAPSRFGLGYWPTASATGRGYATAAGRVILAPRGDSEGRPTSWQA